MKLTIGMPSFNNFEEVFLQLLHWDRENIDIKHPSDYATGIAYNAAFLTNQKVTQKQIAEVGRCSAATLRKRYMDIKARLKIDPEGWLEKYKK